VNLVTNYIRLNIHIKFSISFVAHYLFTMIFNANFCHNNYLPIQCVLYYDSLPYHNTRTRPISKSIPNIILDDRYAYFFIWIIISKFFYNFKYYNLLWLEVPWYWRKIFKQQPRGLMHVHWMPKWLMSKLHTGTRRSSRGPIQSYNIYGLNLQQFNLTLILIKEIISVTDQD